MTTKPVQPEKQRIPAASHLYRKTQHNEHSTLVAPFHAIRFSINMPACRIGEISSKVRMQILPHRKPKKTKPSLYSHANFFIQPSGIFKLSNQIVAITSMFIFLF